MKKGFVALVVLSIGLAGLGIWWYWPSSGEPPVLPKIDEIQEVRLTQPNGTIIPLDMEEKIISFVYFAKDSHKTRQESVTDQPRKELQPFRIDLVLHQGGTKTVYIYQKGQKTYLESPYTGIYEMEHTLSDWLSGKLDY